MKDMRLIYEGWLRSRSGTDWRVELRSDVYEGRGGETGWLMLEGDEPLVIEWGESRKESVIQGSMATLTLHSEGDRIYEGLYSIAPGEIRLDVYRGGELYWSGMLDPEFYEEPYERGANYPVSLTFSDFGILERLNYDGDGIRSLDEILCEAVSRSGIRLAEVDPMVYCVTTRLPGNSGNVLELTGISSGNFYDEEGEAMTLREAVEGILQPLGLKMIQRSGRVYVYDLNWLCQPGVAPTERIYWSGDRSTMGVDRVANNVRIRFSPYCDRGLSTEEMVYPGAADPNDFNPFINNAEDCLRGYYSYFKDRNPETIADYKSLTSDIDRGRWLNFTLHLSDIGKTPLRPSRFKIVPHLKGPGECIGYMHSAPAGAESRVGGLGLDITGTTGTLGGKELLKLPGLRVPGLGEKERSRYLLRITADMLIDTRYNPFSDSKDYNDIYYDIQEGYRIFSGEFMENLHFAFAKCRLVLAGDDGKTYAYTNDDVAGLYWGNLGDTDARNLSGVLGHWKKVTGDAPFCRLEWYGSTQMAMGKGWVANRQAVGGWRPEQRSEVINNIDSGQYMPYPPVGGELRFTMYTGLDCCNEWDSADALPPWDYPNREFQNAIYKYAKWLLYRNVKIELVNNDMTLTEVEPGDVEYSGYINKDAMEEITIDTVAGTMPEVSPTARGVYLDMSTGSQVYEMERAGVTDHPEKLLIGTLYSQYASRHTVLSGETELLTGGVRAYVDAAQPATKRFMMAGDVQDVIADISEARFVEVSRDEYIAIEEVE